MDVEPSRVNGYAQGRPPEREPHVLDAVVEAAIESLPAATRLYPDVYSWQVVDAVLAALDSQSSKSLNA